MLTSPVIIRKATPGRALAGCVDGLMGLVVAGLGRLDRPWQEHARRNAFEAVAALRREGASRPARPLSTTPMHPPVGDGASVSLF